MVCGHLEELERALTKAGISETFRGQAWSRNCREWVYFDCLLDIAAIRQTFELPPFVRDHFNDDPRSGRERGLFCERCHDAIVGLHPMDGSGKSRFPTS